MTAQQTHVVTDDTPHAELAEALEARARRLMAERARLPLTWQTRADRVRLLGMVNDCLDEFLAVR